VSEREGGMATSDTNGPRGRLARVGDSVRRYGDPHVKHQHRMANRTFGQRAADGTSAFVGSWTFVGLYVALTLLWVLVNVAQLVHHFDPYPFIFYTFSVSVLAILMSSLILLAGNRQAEVDRAHAENSYHHVDEVNAKQDEQIAILMGQNKVLQEQNTMMLSQHEELLSALNELKARA
jgi:uncharacterized membrane protein